MDCSNPQPLYGPFSFALDGKSQFLYLFYFIIYLCKIPVRLKHKCIRLNVLLQYIQNEPDG